VTGTPTTPRHLARIIGTVDTTRLVPIDPQANLAAADAASTAAMRDLLATDEVDFYLTRRSGTTLNSTRFLRVPFGCSGVDIPTVPTTTSMVSVWLHEDRDTYRHVIEDTDRPLTMALSGVIAAILFRGIFGTDTRIFDLGPQFGFIGFTPTHVQVGWRPDDTEVPLGNRWLEFPYGDPGISNYFGTTTEDPRHATWLWLTDPETGHPGENAWKVSHVPEHGLDHASARIDDPLEQPPSRPPVLQPEAATADVGA
jgi:hypothetical protein